MSTVLPARRPDGSLDPAAIERAAGVLRAGGLVAMPTETVYGLAADARDASAVRRIFAAKGRPAFNPLIVHVASIAEAQALAADWSATAARVAEAFWPGPVSLVVPRGEGIPEEVTAGLPTVAIRFPSHPVARALIVATGRPLAAPSANRSNHVSPTTAAHVRRSLGDRVDLILDDGPCALGIESTVLDVSGARARLLRPGGLPTADLDGLLGPIERVAEARAGEARASPGLMERHYAPDARAQLVAPQGFAAVLAVLPPDTRIGVLGRSTAPVDDRRIVRWESMPSDPIGYARDVYAALHRLEEYAVTDVLIEALPVASAWAAVADRVRRATG